jgi:hypothetical protein
MDDHDHVDDRGQDENGVARRVRRAQLLLERERAAARRRRRGFALRSPLSQPLVLPGSGRARLG